jgi:hypothetical protein
MLFGPIDSNFGWLSLLLTLLLVSIFHSTQEPVELAAGYRAMHAALRSAIVLLVPSLASI